jgi:hypothetical protein
VSTVTEPTSSGVPVTAEDVADSRPAARWLVEERAWKQLLPDLPDEVIALLAAPVVVSAVGTESPRPSGPPGPPGPPGPAAEQFAVVPPGERLPHFIAPAPPRRDRGRRRTARV